MFKKHVLKLPKHSMLLACHQSDLKNKKVIWHEIILRKHFDAEKTKTHYSQRRQRTEVRGLRSTNR